METQDFVIEHATDDLMMILKTDEIKRLMINAMQWLTGLCQDPDLLTKENLYPETERLLKFYRDELRAYGESLSDYREAILITCDEQSTIVRFRGYRSE